MRRLHRTVVDGPPAAHEIWASYMMTWKVLFRRIPGAAADVGAEDPVMTCQRRAPGTVTPPVHVIPPLQYLLNQQ